MQYIHKDLNKDEFNNMIFKYSSMFLDYAKEKPKSVINPYDLGSIVAASYNPFTTVSTSANNANSVNEDLYYPSNASVSYIPSFDADSISTTLDKEIEKGLRNPLGLETYVVSPLNISVRRVSQETLGPGVLGRTWAGTGIVEVLYHLTGENYIEVVAHEAEHNLDPEAPEAIIRERTKRKLPFVTRWH